MLITVAFGRNEARTAASTSVRRVNFFSRNFASFRVEIVPYQRLFVQPLV
jgi:hypothetical protein